jgi:hypothetical protein
MVFIDDIEVCVGFSVALRLIEFYELIPKGGDFTYE